MPFKKQNAHRNLIGRFRTNDFTQMVKVGVSLMTNAEARASGK